MAYVTAHTRRDPPASDLMSRDRLLGALSARSSGAGGALVTTVVAPAGYGKSVLVEQWRQTAAMRSRRFTAIRLDERDNDPARFWWRLADAAAELGAQLGETAEPLLRDEMRDAPDSPPEAFLARLLGALEGVPERGVLVLDELHRITNGVVRDGLGDLIAGCPATTHVVLLSRAAISGVRLHRLRSAGRLHELTARDLAFDAREAHALVARVSGRPIDRADLQILIERTQGWVTGLRYAALALRHARDPGAYVRGFAGHIRDLREFLVHEVLDDEPPDRRAFLLDVCVLDELTGPACDWLTGRSDSTTLLRELEAGGSFVTGVDEYRQRFRLQPLFRDLLLDQLRLLPGERAAVANGRASQWYEQAGDFSLAVEHALPGAEFSRAAALMAALVPDLHRRGLDATLQRWFAALPAGLLAERPQLALKQAWISAYGDDPRAAVQWCERADLAAGSKSAGSTSAGDEVRTESACLRAVAYWMLGDPASALDWGATSLALLDSRDHDHRQADSYARLAMVGAVAEAYGATGRAEVGARLLSDNLDRVRDTPSAFAAVGLPSTMAGLQSRLGRLDQAAAFAEQALAEAARIGLSTGAPIAEAHVALGERHWERDELTASASSFERAVDCAAAARSVWVRGRALLGLAKCRSALRQFAAAGQVLDTIREIYPRGALPGFVQAQVAEMRLLMAARRMDARAARDQLETLAGLPVAPARWDQLTDVVLLIEGRYPDMVERRIAQPAAVSPTAAGPKVAGPTAARTSAAGTATNPRAELERLLVDLRLATVTGAAQADELLVRILVLGQAGGFVRTVIGPDASLLMTRLRTLPARERARNALSGSYLHLLQQAARRELGRTDDAPTQATRGGMDEPFSEGELAIIRFLPSDFTYAEIATQRHVSVNTVKTQLKSIYRKLGVSTRAGAAERCRQLGLLA